MLITSLKSVVFDFPENQEILERIFGKDGDPIAPNWFELTQERLSELIEELHGSDNEEEKLLWRQCTIARAIITFAKSYGGEIYTVYTVDNTLEFQFSFDEELHGFRFQCDVEDYVQNATGLQP